MKNNISLFKNSTGHPRKLRTSCNQQPSIKWKPMTWSHYFNIFPILTELDNIFSLREAILRNLAIHIIGHITVLKWENVPAFCSPWIRLSKTMLISVWGSHSRPRIKPPMANCDKFQEIHSKDCDPLRVIGSKYFFFNDYSFWNHHKLILHLGTISNNLWKINKILKVSQRQFFKASCLFSYF